MWLLWCLSPGEQSIAKLCEKSEIDYIVKDIQLVRESGDVQVTIHWGYTFIYFTNTIIGTGCPVMDSLSQLEG